MISSFVMSRSLFSTLSFYEIGIHVGTAVAEKLPGLSHFGNAVEIQIGGEHFVFVARGLGDNLSPGIAEIAVSVELADVPGRLGTDSIDGAGVISVGAARGRLFELPQVLAETGHCGGRVEDDLRAV